MGSFKYHIEFLGASGVVTGSKTLLKHQGKSFLIDCGLFQGGKELRELNWKRPNWDFMGLDGVFLTHAHLDHSGYLPKLYQMGFRAPIYCSLGTADLCEILWKDAAKIQEEDAEYANKSGYSYHKPAKPLFDSTDVEGALTLLRVKPLNHYFELAPQISCRFSRSGHIVGSSFVEILLTGDGQNQKKLLFSGDLGHHRSLTLKGPEQIKEADWLLLESTYGDRLHVKTEALEVFGAMISKVLKRNGVLLMPAFAVGRAQELLYAIRKLQDEGQIPLSPVYLDSPMADKATDVYLKHKIEQKLDTAFTGGSEKLFPHNLRVIRTADESMLACMEDGPLIVIAGAGMLNGGRILHHLSKRISDEKNGVLFAGYLAEGTKGRYLLDKGKTEGQFRIYHQEVEVKAEIMSFLSFSAHADYQETIEWLEGFQKLPSVIVLNHGSPESSLSLKAKIEERFVNVKVFLSHEIKNFNN